MSGATISGECTVEGCGWAMKTTDLDEYVAAEKAHRSLHATPLGANPLGADDRDATDVGGVSA